MDTEKSPSRSFQIEYFEDTNRWIAQVWIAGKSASTNRALLYVYGAPSVVSVQVSQDDNWLAVNDHEGSDHARPILFKRTFGLDFQRVAVDLGNVLWDSVSTSQGLSEKLAFDHSYSEAVCWLGRSHSILFRVWGHQSGEYSLRDWFCLYDVDTGKISFDLGALNKRAFQFAKRGRLRRQPRSLSGKRMSRAGSG